MFSRVKLPLLQDFEDDSQFPSEDGYKTELIDTFV